MDEAQTPEARLRDLTESNNTRVALFANRGVNIDGTILLDIRVKTLAEVLLDDCDAVTLTEYETMVQERYAVRLTEIHEQVTRVRLTQGLQEMKLPPRG